MDRETQQRLVRQMFDQTASRYVERIDPAFKPLAEGLVDFAALQPHERVLDLGTGTGLAALAAARHAGQVVGLDHSRPLLKQARTKPGGPTGNTVTFVQGDMHWLGLRDGTFDVVMGAFSFNSTDPARVFPEVFRVLAPGGRLAMQEWGTKDPLSEIVYDVLDEYCVDDPPPPLAALREALSTPDAWDDLEGIDDLTETLEKAGFQNVTSRTETQSVPFPDIDAFLSYKLAWASRHQELQAMPQEMQDLLYSELHDQMEPHLSTGGNLLWQPEVVRVKATRPTP